VTEQPETPQPAAPDGVTPAEAAPDAVTRAETASEAPTSTAASSWATPPEPVRDSVATDGTDAMESERPEVAIGAAFAGGFILAMLMRRLAR
jgi:hypothetical protein